MFIDTHCHLVGDYSGADDLDAIVKRAIDANVGVLVCPGAEPDDLNKQIEIITKYDNIFATIGVHPEAAENMPDVAALFPDSVFENQKIIGIGEIGLDYHYGAEFKKQQIELFEQQLDIARRNNMPVAIHTRDAEADTIAILDNRVRGVMHSFTSSWEMARIMLDRGFFFSANGILTFKNADELRETYKKIPIDHIVIETDSPYLAPVPYRGKKCEPFMVTEVAKALADIKGLHLADLEDILGQNTKTLYPRIKI